MQGWTSRLWKLNVAIDYLIALVFNPSFTSSIHSQNVALLIGINKNWVYIEICSKLFIKKHKDMWNLTLEYRAYKSNKDTKHEAPLWYNTKMEKQLISFFWSIRVLASKSLRWNFKSWPVQMKYVSYWFYFK